jgi:type I restriction enzyme S subunit
MSENITPPPLDWKIFSLEDISSHITSGGTPTSGDARYYVEGTGLPFAKTEDLTRSTSKYVESCELSITPAALKESAAKKYPVGTILISMYGTIGLTKITACEMAANQALCALLPPFSCDRDYLFHHLEFIRNEWLAFSGQTTQANINGAVVRSKKVPLPPAKEQAVIARILDSLDTTIRQTEVIIEKLKQVKQGLLHDLLTRGIDANGELRPPQSEAPELYKESALGWIPKEWTPRALGTLADVSGGVTLGRSISGPGVVELPYLRVANVQDGYLDLDEIKTVQVLSSEVARYKLEPGDVLMNEGGDFDKLGRGVIWSGELETCLHQNHVFRVRCSRVDLDPRYLAAYSASRFGKSYFVQASKQTTNLASINSTQLKAFPLMLPPPEEQRAIVEKLAGLDLRVESEARTKQKLLAQKSGLMDDLLTGRVRVTPLLESQAA